MLDFETDYQTWRKARLGAWPSNYHIKIIDINNPAQLSAEEKSELRQQCERTNFACYRLASNDNPEKDAIRKMTQQLGMPPLDQNLCADNDSISTLKVMDLGRAQGYVPYTNKPLNWHTDGYYNSFDNHIRSFLLHCVQNAESGGETMLMNHELLYIYLNDQDPRLITALMQDDALTIPANHENGVEIRPAQTGPVFYRDAKTQHLQMRYTARTRSIEWKDDPVIHQATQLITQFLAMDDSVLKLTLNPGEGIICNNLLHGRTAFSHTNSEQQRILFRARSYNRLFS